MVDFILGLKSRNELLFYFAVVNFGIAFIALVISVFNTTTVYNVNAMYKPTKFALSIGVYAITMVVICSYLKNFNLQFFNWSIILSLGFEIVYIFFKALQGKTSHYNTQGSLNSVFFVLMIVGATYTALYTAYVAIQFFGENHIDLPPAYLWAIRIGLILFVIFSFQGFSMGSIASHTVGAANHNSNLFLLGWSNLFGDLRIAHFLGMHALQILPLVAYYAKNSLVVFSVAALYALVCFYALFQALAAKPLFSV